jgi:hypothetical protein
MNPERTAVVITIIVILCSLFAFAAFHYYELYRPQIAEPLVVGFQVKTGDGEYKHTNVGVEGDRVARFDLPANSQIEFNYHIACGGNARITQNNVTLYLVSKSNELGFLDAKNQTVVLPFKQDVGSMEINSGRQFTATLQTPSQAGTYQMQWRITSDHTDYSFLVLSRVGGITADENNLVLTRGLGWTDFFFVFLLIVNIIALILVKKGILPNPTSRERKLNFLIGLTAGVTAFSIGLIWSIFFS